MALNKDQQNRISEVVKEILLRRIESFPELGAEIRNAPFHTAFLECFNDRLGSLKIETSYLIAIASWLHGLNTSLGTGFESISHILSGGYKRSFTNAYKLHVKKDQATQIENIIRDLKSGNHLPDLKREEDLIFGFTKQDKTIESLAFTVDTYIERADEIIAVELKSVIPRCC